MKLTHVITPGDKIDIRLISQLRTEEDGGEIAKVYHSSVCDELSDMELEISMPTYQGKMILFQMNARCEFVFYTRSGMYKCRGIVHGRYRKESLYLLDVRMETELTKFQRREFFRIDYVTKLAYYHLEENLMQASEEQDIWAFLRKPEKTEDGCQGTTQDISGGGIRFVSREQLHKNQYIFLAFRLENERMAESFELFGKVVEAQLHPSQKDLFVNRVQFLFHDLKEREDIVRFVFEEERRIRRKEVR